MPYWNLVQYGFDGAALLMKGFAQVTHAGRALNVIMAWLWPGLSYTLAPLAFHSHRFFTVLCMSKS
jgi:hypothetical protein